MSKTTWAAALADSTTDMENVYTYFSGSDCSTCEQDTTESNVVAWFQSFYINQEAANHFYASAWQPNWPVPYVAAGFPRFGASEANDGKLSYFLLNPGDSYTVADDVIDWTDISGASYLVAGCVALATLLLF